MRRLQPGILLLMLTSLFACGGQVVGWNTTDRTAPIVSSTTPANGAVEVPFNAPITATFSEPMDPLTITADTFTVLAGTTPIPGTVSYTGVTALFVPIVRFGPDQVFTATIKAGVKDEAGNAMAADHVWSYSTGTAPDTTPPGVSSTTPVNGASEVAFNAPVTATFTEPMDPLTLTTTTFILLDGVTPVPGTVGLVGVTATFTPDDALVPDTLYRAVLSVGATDLAGNPLTGEYAWSFTTGTAPDTTPPQVSATTPASDETGVALNAPITATFDSWMDPLTINTATFLLRIGTTAVPGTVMYSGITAIFTPDEVLEAGTVYEAVVTTGVADNAGNTMAANYAWSFATGMIADTTAPEVSSTTPVNGEVEVAFNVPVIATFSEAMDPLTISTATFTLIDGILPVPGTVDYVGVTATFTPTAALAPDTQYKAMISYAVEDLAGNPMYEDYVWVFTTGTAADTTAPMVSWTTPYHGATGVAFNAPITATFSEPMAPLTISSATFTLLDGTTPVPGTVMYVGTTAVFSPTDDLAPGTLLVATIKTGAKDLAGNSLTEDYVWSFTTGTVADTTPPQVSSTTPLSGAVNVAFNAPIAATFSEAMNPLTITTATFTLFDGTTPVPGAVTYVGVTAIFKPVASLAPDTLYKATIKTGARDLAGNAMVKDYVWNFSTGTAADLTRPQVSSTTPVIGAVEVAFNAPITATFSEAMNPLTITTATFTLMNGSIVVTGAVSYVGVTAKFMPTVALAPDTLYKATIKAGAKDLAGNSLASDYVWTFTTGPVPDTQSPRVTFTVPADDATGVAVGGTLAAVFSEPMDPLTITTVNFTVQQLATYVVGTVTYTNVTATFHPVVPLAPNTTYSATITTEAQDLAGNALVANYVWNFKTGVTPDTTRPLVISTIPLNLATGVALDTNVSATFNEMMDPLTLTTLTFTVFDGLLPVLGIVTQTGATAIFNPAVDLDPDTEYTATIDSLAADLAGNTLIADHVWTFTTGAAPDDDAPTIVLTKPADLDIDVPVSATVNATFSEAMDPLTITTATFTLKGPGNVEVLGTVLYDPLTRIGTFKPGIELLPDTTYTATVSNLATDMAGNSLAAGLVPNPWTFKTAAVAQPFVSISLGLATPFAITATAGVTNTATSPITHIDGDVVLDPNQTCNEVTVDNTGDFGLCNNMAPTINGTVITNTYPDTTTSGFIKSDLNAGFLSITPLAGPPAVGSLGGGTPLAAPMTLGNVTGSALVLGDNHFTPGVYTSITSILISGDVVLDGQGDANAMFVFQAASTLTTADGAPSPGAHTRILLTNGTKASNVWWQVGSSATLGLYTEFQGNVLAAFDITMKTGSKSCGRMMAGAWVGGAGAFVFDSNVVSVPGNGCPQ